MSWACRSVPAGRRDRCVEFEALLAQIAGIADDEADAVERAVLEAGDVNAVERQVEFERTIEPARLEAQFVVLDRLAIEQALGRNQRAAAPNVDNDGMPPPEL